MYNYAGNTYKVICANKSFTFHDLKMLCLKVVVKNIAIAGIARSYKSCSKMLSHNAQ